MVTANSKPRLRNIGGHHTPGGHGKDASAMLAPAIMVQGTAAPDVAALRRIAGLPPAGGA
jgi:hypothetical protein